MFNAFSPLNGGSLQTYRYKSESPFDFDAGLDYTRPATGVSVFPFPVAIGYVDGLPHLQNRMEFQVMQGKVPFGPWQGVQSAPVEMVFPNIMGGLAKVNG